jgi:uncharacterized protein (DUF2062 family)
MWARIAERTKRVLKDIASFHGSPTQVARGAAVGAFVAFTPTLGVQIIIAVFVATAVRANRAAAVALVWITNPATALPIYTFCYAQGRRFTGGPGVREVSSQLRHTFRRVEGHGFWDIFDRLAELSKIGGEVLWPMTVGGIITGAVAGAATYLVTLLLVRVTRAIFGHHHHHPKPDAGTDAKVATPDPASQQAA